MKISAKPTARLVSNREDAIKMIQSIYEEVETEFDESCICKYEILMNEGFFEEIKVFYEYIKVTPKGSPSIYWPIQPCSDDYNINKFIELAKKQEGRS
jgi:hypothetical protein